MIIFGLPILLCSTLLNGSSNSGYHCFLLNFIERKNFKWLTIKNGIYSIFWFTLYRVNKIPYYSSLIKILIL